MVYLSAFMFLVGLFFFGVGTLGLIRFPDSLTRMHAATKCDTLGAGLVLGALALHGGAPGASVKLILIIFFIWITNPTAAHIIARAKYRHDQKGADSR
jgi:multicomponent Na+:H+ antiporter subunit G